MTFSQTPVSAKEQALVELAHWLARVLQYSSSHPSCAPLAERTHQAIGRALKLEAPVEYGILKDDVVMGEDRAVHRSTKLRMAPYLHERGVLVLRFAHGVTLEELSSFVELIARPAQAIFESGGLVRLAVDRRIARITVEEIAHEITDEEREEHRRRKRMRTFFSEMLHRMLAQRGIGMLAGDQLAELLSHPEVAVRIIEDDAHGVAEAVACLALLVRQEEVRGKTDLLPPLVTVLSALSPEARDKVVLGFAPLVGEFRQALSWAVDGFTEDALARFVFPSVYAHADDLEPVLYSLSVLVVHDGTRVSVCRRMGLLLFDLPEDEPGAVEALRQLGAPVPPYDSFRRERECLAESASQALWLWQAVPERVAQGASRAPPAPQVGERFSLDAKASIYELVNMAGRMRDFDKVAPKLAAVVGALGPGESSDAALGVLQGLGSITTPDWRELALRTLREAATPPVVLRALEDIERATAQLEGQDTGELLKIFSHERPGEVFERLERSESRKMRRALLVALSTVGPALLPTLRGKLVGVPWYVARNAILLLPRAGGSPKDLAPVARHPNEKVRLEIVRALRAMPAETGSMDILAAYLTDAADEVAQGARAILRGDLLGPIAIAELARLFEDERASDDLRRHGIKLLGQSSDDAAATALFKALQPKGLIELGSGSAGLRDFVASALYTSPAPAAKGLFKQGLGSTVWRVRKACERAAGGAS
jgi:hypothetical protein